MDKIDFKKTLKQYYAARSGVFDIVEVPEMWFLMVDGTGNPNTAQSFSDAVESLYKLSYTLKFMVKKGDIGIDYGVMPLEALWWADDMSVFTSDSKDSWKWTVMIMQPELISTEMVEEATDEVRRKKNPAALSHVRFEAFREGPAAQTLHVGPFSEEGPTIEKLHSFIEKSGSRRSGKHHEIYLSDIRRAAPEKWKTIIRQGYEPVAST